MKAIHNVRLSGFLTDFVVLYPKDTEKWKQFTTEWTTCPSNSMLFCIPKILKNESNSQLWRVWFSYGNCCFVSQRYWKMKAIHNSINLRFKESFVVLYPKDTEKWKQFTTVRRFLFVFHLLFCIPKILKNESNSQRYAFSFVAYVCCFVSQRYWKMKAIHNYFWLKFLMAFVVLYPKDTEKWKQFTTGRKTYYFR